ncbi:hypothetical protein ACFL50_01060 [Candidatus Latescibacterota bacterium]
METIIVPVDGASNIKLEVLDFETLTTVFSRTSETPVKETGGLQYNSTGEECRWFDRTIRELPEDMKSVRVIAPVARGASGGLVGPDNTLMEVPGEDLTLSYTQEYSDAVENIFCELAGNKQDFFLETGSVRDFQGSMTLIKRFVFEEIERPGLIERAECFGTYGALLSGHFLGDDFLRAVKISGNEHSYWMCHTGARNINESPGTPSSLAVKIKSFRRLVPETSCTAYIRLGNMPERQAEALGITGDCLVIPGGHDTCLSHIPVMSTFYQAFKEKAGTPVIHVEAGSWTLVASIGGAVELPADGYERDIIVQGTVDGYPVVTARYGGGNDFRCIKGLMAERGLKFGGEPDMRFLSEALDDSDCFVLPNLHPVNYRTGPFPELRGKIVNERAFFENPGMAYIIMNLTTSITTAYQIDNMSGNSNPDIVITAGGSKDPLFGGLIATLTGKNVYAMFDRGGNAVTETTTLGAAITGKAAYLNIHPYNVDVIGLGIIYRKIKPFDNNIKHKLEKYRERFLKKIGENMAI